jgi:RNA polymerase subunit RPABC4/transcription elongation factor Spt4
MTDILNQALDNPIIPAIGMAVAGTVGALWLAAAWWVYRDASWRTGSWILGMVASGWIILSTPVLVPLSLGVYVLARPQQSAAQGRSRRLVEELVEQLDAEGGGSCPTCKSSIEAEWVRCPACSTWLAQPCAHCRAWSDRDLEICPWCGSEDRAEPAVEERKPAAAIAVPRKGSKRRGSRQPVAVMGFDLRQPRARLESWLDTRPSPRPPARAGSR